eukprot:365319-Chlamydomonas_euryale.AAC.1
MQGSVCARAVIQLNPANCVEGAWWAGGCAPQPNSATCPIGSRQQSLFAAGSNLRRLPHWQHAAPMFRSRQQPPPLSPLAAGSRTP